MPDPLPRSFYARDPVTVARALLGKHLVRRAAQGTVVGRIVEVEAYLAAGDPASHGRRGATRSNAAMFGPPGHAYVYSIHARHCVNAVTGPAGTPSAVLIRAVEPLAGVDLMRRRRRDQRQLWLARGPARLCEAFAVDRGLDGWDLTCGARLWVTAPPRRESIAVGVTGRVGVTAAADLPLRFFDATSRFVSLPRHPRHDAG